MSGISRYSCSWMKQQLQGKQYRTYMLKERKHSALPSTLNIGNPQVQAFLSDKNNHGSPDLEVLILPQTQKGRECDKLSGGVSRMNFSLCFQKRAALTENHSTSGKETKRKEKTTDQQIRAPKQKPRSTRSKDKKNHHSRANRGLIQYVNTEAVYCIVIRDNIQCQ